MRYGFSVVFAGLAAVVLCAGSAIASDVEVKGPHICCGQCVKVVGKILEKVDGVSEVKADMTTKTVTFTAKDNAAAKAGFKALVDGGFFGAATEDGKELKLKGLKLKKGEKADTVAVKDVHVCCGQCEKAIMKLFKDSTVTFEGKGPQRTVSISGAELEASAVVAALRKAGFNGTPVK
jgi:periplasmic mercuric ion binding protein